MYESSIAEKLQKILNDPQMWLGHHHFLHERNFVQLNSSILNRILLLATKQVETFRYLFVNTNSCQSNSPYTHHRIQNIIQSAALPHPPLQCQLSLILEIQFENITKQLDPPQCNFYRTVSNFHGFGLILYCILLTICFK